MTPSFFNLLPAHSNLHTLWGRIRRTLFLRIRPRTTAPQPYHCPLQPLLWTASPLSPGELGDPNPAWRRPQRLAEAWRRVRADLEAPAVEQGVLTAEPTRLETRDAPAHRLHGCSPFGPFDGG